MEEADDPGTPDIAEHEVTVTVTLSADPERTVTIPLSATNQNGASNADYSGVPNSLTFSATETQKTFTFSATDDAVDDDGESVKLGFGSLPAGVSAGTTNETTISITDNDVPNVEVSFGAEDIQHRRRQQRTGQSGPGHSPGAGGDHSPERHQPGRGH